MAWRPFERKEGEGESGGGKKRMYASGPTRAEEWPIQAPSSGPVPYICLTLASVCPARALQPFLHPFNVAVHWPYLRVAPHTQSEYYPRPQKLPSLIGRGERGCKAQCHSTSLPPSYLFTPSSTHASSSLPLQSCVSCILVL